MSWGIFKQNILRYANDPKSLKDTEDIARVWATEYDAAVKRGYDNVNLVSVKQGNVDLMTELLKIAFDRGLTSKQPYDLVGAMGDAVKAYWSGAVLNEFPIPVVPAPGSTSNIATTTNIVLNVGTWTPQIVLPPELQVLEVYDKLDWSQIPVDRYSDDVQEIVRPNLSNINLRIETELASDPDAGNVDEISSLVSQINNLVSQKLNNALYDQKILEQPSETDSSLSSKFGNLRDLLLVAAKYAPILKKSPVITYNTLSSNYNSAFHGKCPQGVQCVLVALTGITGLGTLSGNADWFSFKNPGTGGGNNSFAKPIGGKTYYNNKVRVGMDYINDSKQWQVGDILANGYVGTGVPSRYGHIQIWTGFKWMSDFTQSRIHTKNMDRQTVALWRLNDEGKALVNSRSIS
jgi:hypothetical protein